MTPAYSVRPVEDTEMTHWDDFVDSSVNGTFYHTSVWRQVINSAYIDGQYTIIGLWRGSQIIGGFCALTRKRLAVNTAVTPLCTPYTGLVVSTVMLDDDEALAHLLNYMRKYRYQHIQCSPGLPQHQAFADAHYDVGPRRTLEINLGLTEDELWASFESNVRRNIRKAEKQTWQISAEWDADACYKLFCETFEHQGSTCPVPQRLFDEISTSPLLAPYRAVHVARDAGRAVAFIVALRYNGTVYYELAATSHNHRSSGIASLLIWQLLKEHRALGYKTFDFMGGNIPSISQFKEKFNPTVRPYFQLQLNLSRRIRLARLLSKVVKGRS